MPTDRIALQCQGCHKVLLEWDDKLQKTFNEAMVVATMYLIKKMPVGTVIRHLMFAYCLTCSPYDKGTLPTQPGAKA